VPTSSPVERYADLERPTLRATARATALDLLASAGRLTGRTAAALARPRVHFVYLHHVFGDEEAGFRALVAHLGRGARIVPYSEAVARVRRGPIDRPCVAFSFDDGFASCRRAAEILEEHGARACFFVVPSMIGERSPELEVVFAVRLLGDMAIHVLDLALEVAGIQCALHRYSFGVGRRTHRRSRSGCTCNDEVRLTQGILLGELVYRCLSQPA